MVFHNHSQAEALDAALAKMGEKVDYAINVDVPDETLSAAWAAEELVQAAERPTISFIMRRRQSGICGDNLRRRTDSAR